MEICHSTKKNSSPCNDKLIQFLIFEDFFSDDMSSRFLCFFLLNSQLMLAKANLNAII